MSKMCESKVQTLSDFQQSMKVMRFSLPIVASMISQTIISFVDYKMVSNLGTEAQAAIVPSGMLLFCFIAFSNGLFTACNTLTSQSLGRGDERGCGRYAWQGLYLAGIYSLVLLPLYYLAPTYFGWLKHEPAVRELEITYFQICLLGVFPMVAGKALGSFTNGLHRPGIGFGAMLAGNIFNIIGNYALIEGNWGFKAYGVAGAAYATVAASILQFVILFVWMLGRELDERFGIRRGASFDWVRVKEVLKLGTPTGVQNSIEIIGFTVFVQVLVGRFGTVELAATNTCFKLLEVAFMPAVGLSVALTALVGKAIGGKDIELARQYTRCAVRIALVYMTTVGVFYMVFRHDVGGWFNNDDPQVHAWVAKILICCGLFQLFDALGIIYNGALRGTGDTLVPAIIQSGVSLIVSIGGGFGMALFWPELGSVGPWIAITAYIAILGICLAVRWKREKWIKDAHPYPDLGEGEAV